MESENKSAVIQAELEGEKFPVTAWYFIGFFLGIIGILIVYLRSPKVPVRLLVEYDGEDRYFFEKAYVDVLNRRQVKATWIGLAIGFILWIGLYLLFMIFTFLALHYF